MKAVQGQRSVSPLFYCLCCLAVLSSFALLPLWLESYVDGWDHLGQLFKARLIADYYFPDYHGWNPWFYLGSVEGPHYPWFFHWLTAALSQLIPLEQAYKLLITLAMMFCWPAVYLFLRSFKFGWESASLGATSFFLCQFFIKGYAGASFHSAIKIGNAAETFSLPMLFLFAAALPDLKSRRSARALALLVLLFLCHMVSSLIALIMLAAYIVHSGERETLKNSLWLLLTALGLSAFQLLPLFFYGDGSEMRANGGLPLGWLGVGTVVMAAFYWFIALRKLVAPAAALPLMLFICLSFLFLNSISGHPLPLHYPRFMVFIVSTSLMSLCFFIEGLRDDLKRRLTLVLHLCAFSIIGAYAEGLESSAAMPERPAGLPVISGRVLSVSEALDSRPHHQDIYYPSLALGAQGVKGLFLEGTPLGSQVLSLEELVQRSLVRGEVNYWGGFRPRKHSKAKPVHISRLRRFLGLFQVNHVLIDIRQGLPIASSGPVLRLPGGQRLYFLRQTPFASVLPYRPRVFSRHLFKNLNYRRMKYALRERVFVEVGRPAFGSKSAEVKLLSHSPLWDRLEFEVSSDREVPTLIRMAWSPGWRAEQDGRELVIQKAFPGLMLVNASGRFRLVFGRTPLEMISILISGVCLGLIVPRLLSSFSYKVAGAALTERLVLRSLGEGGSEDQ